MTEQQRTTTTTARPDTDDAGRGTVCTECGHSRADRRPPRGRGVVPWRLLAPLAISAFIVAAIAFVLPRASSSDAYGRSHAMPIVHDPPLRIADVEALARGEATADGRRTPLLDGLRHDLRQHRSAYGPVAPLEPGMAVQASAPERSARRRTYRFGWPVPWLTRMAHRELDPDGTPVDVVTDPLAARPRTPGSMFVSEERTVGPTQRWGWWEGVLLFALTPQEANGALVSWGLRPAAIVVPLLAGSIVLFVAAALRRRGRAGVGGRIARRRLAATLATSVTVLLLAVPRTEAYRAWDAPAGAIGIDADLQALDERGRSDPAEAERALAEAVVATGVTRRAGDDHVLVRIAHGTGWVNLEERWFLKALGLFTQTRPTWYENDLFVAHARGAVRPRGTAPVDRVVAPPAGLHAWATNGILHVERTLASGEDARSTTRWSVAVPEAIVVLGGTLGLLVGPWLVWPIVVRRRRRRGLCIACGHRVVPESATYG